MIYETIYETIRRRQQTIEVCHVICNLPSVSSGLTKMTSYACQRDASLYIEALQTVRRQL